MWWYCHGGDTWAVEASGASNAAHVTVNDPTTYSWGFMHSSSAQRNEADWKRALALGPNDVEGGACAQGAAGIAEATAQFTISDEQMAALTNRAAGNAFILGLAVGVAASIAVAIVLAVYIPPQAPAPGHAFRTISFRASSSIRPARYSP